MFFLCRTSSRPSGSVPSAPSTSLFAETSLGVSLPGSSSSSSSLPLGGQGKRGGSRGAPSVFYEVLLPLPLDFGPARGAGVPLGICLSRAGSLLLLLLLQEVGARELALLLQTPFSRFSSSVDSPQFSPHVPRRENSRESSVSCSRVLSSRESRSSERGSRVDTRARSREVSSRGRRCRSRSRSSYRSRLSGRERGRRSSSASRSSRGRSCCERSRSSDRYRSQRGSSRSRCAWSRSSDRYRSRRDRSRRERSRSFDRYRSRRERARSPACRGVRRGRSRSHALPVRSRDRSRSSVRLPASPARLRAVEAGRLARRGPPEGVEAFVSQPPVAWSSGGRPSCSGGASIAALPSVFAGACQVLHELVWLLFPGSTWSLGGCDRYCSSVGGYRVSRFDCCWGGHFLCCDCDACWGWRFCLLLPLLSLACLVTSSVGGIPLSRASQSVVW